MAEQGTVNALVVGSSPALRGRKGIKLRLRSWQGSPYLWQCRSVSVARSERNPVACTNQGILGALPVQN